MSELPECLEGGEVARLIPVGSAGQRERAACTVLLAALRVVQPFAREFFGRMEWRAGNWAQVYSYTEPVFKKQPEGLTCRPDGLLILNTTRRELRFIVEAKIGTARIDPNQLADQCRLARLNDVDALITVSNELSPDPAYLPYEAPREARNLRIYHWSWPRLVMLAELLLRDEDDFDEEQDYMLREIIRFWDHESSGINCTNHMCADWPNVVERIQVGTPLPQNDDAVLSVISCWHQALASVCINRTRRLKLPVTLRLSRDHWDQQTRLAEDTAEFVASNRLHAEFEFAAAELPVEVIADAGRRNIIFRLSVGAPLNRQRYGARLRWLLNQLPEETTMPITINLIWDRGLRSSALLGDLRDDLNAARIDNPSGPRSFEIVSILDLAARFGGPRTFVPCLEESLSDFFENVARHVRSWQPIRTVTDADAPQEEFDDTNGEGTTRESERQIVQQGQIGGRSFSIFNDGSIEIETASGIQRFRNFAQLQAAAAGRNGHSGPIT